MKKTLLIFMALVTGLSFLSDHSLYAQTVQVCISIDGTPMPVSRKWNMCNANIATPTNLSSVVLKASNCAASPEANVTIKWKNLSVPPYTEFIGSTITATEAGQWEATITNNTTTLAYKDTITLGLYPAIGVSLNDIDYLYAYIEGCPLYDITLIATPLGLVTSYSWYSFAPKVLIPGQITNLYIFKQKNVQYIVNVKDIHNCVAADTTRFYQQTIPIKINLGPDPATFCEGNTFALASTTPFTLSSALYAISYGIVNGPNLGSFNTMGLGSAAPVNITPIAGTNTYWMKIEGYPNCAGYDEIVITTVPKPVVDAGAPSVFACYGTTTNLTTNIILGTAPYNYSWSSIPPSTLPTAASISVNPASTTKYTVSVTDANHCNAGTDTVLLNGNPPLFVSASNDTTICKDPQGIANLSATASGGTGTLSYAWLPTAGLSSTNTLITTASISTTTLYTFTVTDANDCFNSESINVISYEPPVAPITNPSIISETKTATLEALFADNAGSSFLWKTDSSSTILTTGSSLYLEYQGPDTVRYVVIVTNPVNGCINKDTIQVWSISDNTVLYVPNIFSPNASDVQNQTLKVYGNNLHSENFKWLVYNKWGNLMYETSDLVQAQSVGISGESMNEGVYTYVIMGKFKNGKDIKDSPFCKGTFSLVK